MLSSRAASGYCRNIRCATAFHVWAKLYRRERAPGRAKPSASRSMAVAGSMRLRTIPADWTAVQKKRLVSSLRDT
jgi:hypothetical protein